MISRGNAYVFSTSIIVEGCAASTFWGPYCNQTVNMISCSQSLTHKLSRSLLDLTAYKSSGLNPRVRTGAHGKAGYHLLSERYAIEEKQVVSNTSVVTAAENLITCNNPMESSCLYQGELKFYFLDILGLASQFKITVTDFRLNQTSSMNDPSNSSRMLLMCYVRFDAMPLRTLHDHSADISRAPLIVKSPKIGRWFIAIEAVKQTEVNGVIQEAHPEARPCFSFQWQVNECLGGKAGVNCTWETYVLQRVPKRSSGSLFESYYLPIVEHGSTGYSDFYLDQLLSNSSVEQSGWTYFLLDIPHGAAGANMHILLTSDTKVNYEIYSRFGGLPSADSWDYHANGTSNKSSSTFLALNDLSGKRIEFYILYPREGTWCIGLKHPLGNHYKHQTAMSISLDGCPGRCNQNGACRTLIDESGLTFYSYCTCDRDHGGFDCSTQLVTRKGNKDVSHRCFNLCIPVFMFSCLLISI
ncbi:putative Transmembrane protein [Cocos nucifera]|nr:putative Transmembrane protein [Cocos nucifera]